MEVNNNGTSGSVSEFTYTTHTTMNHTVCVCILFFKELHWLFICLHSLSGQWSSLCIRRLHVHKCKRRPQKSQVPTQAPLSDAAKRTLTHTHIYTQRDMRHEGEREKDTMWPQLQNKTRQPQQEKQKNNNKQYRHWKSLGKFTFPSTEGFC